MISDVDCCRLTSVIRIFLKCPAQECDLLTVNGIVHCFNNPLGEASLLMVVHNNHLLPVIGYFVQVIRSSNIYKVQDILLETRPSKTDRRFQEFWTDTG